MKSGNFFRYAFWLLLCGALFATARGATWFPLGPYGGSTRAFGIDPTDNHHLYLGTATGWLYESHDTGANWVRVSRIGKRDDLVIEHILVDPADPKHLIVGAYRVDRPEGGIYISQDSGKDWYEQAQMRGQSVRALTRSTSDPKELVAGTLEGVYRSSDNGVHWKLISPEGSKEIHEVESLAIDPADPNVIYAGTWHLPWKTSDGGATWTNIKEGIIDDSDVFSIIVDPTQPATVYASACSGIYKSLDAGGKFKKIQGIPSTARRTRKLLQDPANLDTVYAGTTEGLYKTTDGGKTFARMTDPNVIINDVYVDPSNPTHVLLATDRGGILSSEDAAATFHASNNGFSARQVSSFASDPHDAGTVYVGVVNDKETGGVFQSVDGGVRWEQRSSGLGGRDVFSLASVEGGALLAGTNHGVFRLGPDGWTDSSDLFVPAPIATDTPADTVQPESRPHAAPHSSPAKPGAKKSPAKPARRTLRQASRPHISPVAYILPRRGPAKHVSAKPAPAKKGKLQTTAPHAAASHKPQAATPRKTAKAPVPSPIPPPPPRLDATVYSLAADRDAIYAGTAEGLYRGTPDGHSWQQVGGLDMQQIPFLGMHGQVIMTADPGHIELSTDGGATWKNIALPSDLTEVRSVAVDEMKDLWVGGREGVYYSPDSGATWKVLRHLFVQGVDGLYFDAPQHRVLVASSASTITFSAHLPDFKVSYWDTGWTLRFVRPAGDHLIGATLFDGMVVQPQMVVSDLKPAQ